MAKAIGLSHATTSRIWHAFGLQPHRSETFKLSPDPLLVPKVRDIVGLYVNPPEHAVVLCVDEKSQIQALDRAAAADAARQARAADARLQTPWHHLAVCRARRQERQSDRPDASPPSVHRVPQFPGPHRRQRARRSRCPPHPGQLRNAQNTAHPGVVRQASPVSRALHTHLWLVAEPRGALVRGTDDEADPAWGASQSKRVGARHRGVSRCSQHRSPPLCLDQVRGSDPGEYRALRTRHHGHPSRTTYVTNHCYRTLGDRFQRCAIEKDSIGDCRSRTAVAAIECCSRSRRKSESGCPKTSPAHTKRTRQEGAEIIGLTFGHFFDAMTISKSKTNCRLRA